jgi:hypothetical protein
MDRLISRVMDEERFEKWEDTLVLACVVIENRKRQARLPILAAEGFALCKCPFGIQIIWQEVALIESKGLF